MPSLPRAPPQNISAAAVAAEVEASTLRLQVPLLHRRQLPARCLMRAQVLGLVDVDVSVRGHRLLAQLEQTLQAW